ncbi:MAG TPA: class I SAM-dependent methyltransferase [Chloroflexota bacterium]
MTTNDQQPAGTDPATERRDALVARLFQATLGFFDVFAVYLGDQLGLYRALAETGWATSSDLSARTGTDERYVREWLEQQAASGIIEVENVGAAPEVRRFTLPAGHEEVLLDRESLSYMTALARLAVSTANPLQALVAAYRSGAGVPYMAYGADAREGIADLNRPMFINLLGSTWLPAIPEVHARLQADPPARVADIGCGAGWSSIAIARAYPTARVDGFDLDEASISNARVNAQQARVSDRVRFEVRDASAPQLASKYDLVTAFETLHDMAHPVEALRMMRALLGQGGSVLIADERVAETFAAPADEIDRFNYGWSILHCLPASRTEPTSAATGTVMRPQTLRRYAEEAGFKQVHVLPIQNDFWRFYRLIP